MKKRKSYPPELKTEIVLKILKEEKSISQLASEYEIHPNQLSMWKSQFLKDAHLIFQGEQKPLEQVKSKYEKQVEELYSEIGKLTTQLNWLKKKCGRNNE
jgi:transposase-like protein